MELALFDRSDRKKRPTLLKFRTLERDEIFKLERGDWYHTISFDGKAIRCRVNGQPKRWATDPWRIEVPFKYGLREYFRYDYSKLSTRVFVGMGEVQWMNPVLFAPQAFWVFKLYDFQEAVKSGVLKDGEGTGKWAQERGQEGSRTLWESNVRVSPSEFVAGSGLLAGFTHVIWYNK